MKLKTVGIDYKLYKERIDVYLYAEEYRYFTFLLRKFPSCAKPQLRLKCFGTFLYSDIWSWLAEMGFMLLAVTGYMPNVLNLMRDLLRIWQSFSSSPGILKEYIYVVGVTKFALQNAGTGTGTYLVFAVTDFSLTCMSFCCKPLSVRLN